MTFDAVLSLCRKAETEKAKGTQFERLMRNWLLTDPRYNRLQYVWLWNDFPEHWQFGTGQDTGIDLVAQDDMGDYWAVQCKCYAENTPIALPAVTNFLAASGKSFTDSRTGKTVHFAARIWISTSDNWTENAEAALEHQSPEVNRVTLFDLQSSPVRWEELLAGKEGHCAAIAGKNPMEHQLRAISAAERYYQTHDRGKLIMACGTGKTFTSLYMMESLLQQRGLVLFLVPSISLLGQTLNEWSQDARKPIKAVCICSDATASKKNTQQNEDDRVLSAVLDLALPASTDPQRVARQLIAYRNHDGLVVVFSTYQSISAVHEAQQEVLRRTGGAYGTFDFIICDEAHRTTGAKKKDGATEDESEFTKVHDNAYIQARKRLYMTATPRVFADSMKAKATESDYLLYSMDNEQWYGEEFYHVGFGYAVDHGLLTDYKVFVLTVNEEDIPADLRRQIENQETRELKYDDTAKLVGVVSGLSKIIRGDGGQTWQVDPRLMHRALVFCSKIGGENQPGTSRNIAQILPYISQKVNEDATPEQREHIVHIAAQHVDGSMSSSERGKHLRWLSQKADDPQECRVITNVRCLSEGVDVPALDAVIFLSPRKSQVDVVQSVGRVMRNFAKGTGNEKKYGYIIIPVVVPANADPDAALQATDFKTVWSILNALRSHDDRFNATVNKIALNRRKNDTVIFGQPGISSFAIGCEGDDADAMPLTDADEMQRQLQLRFGDFQDTFYARLVDKVGDKMYWENWAKQVGVIAKSFIARIERLLREHDDYRREMDKFVRSLQRDLNPAVDQQQAVEMLAQHLITKPVFDALFAQYEFVKNNTVSRSMEAMLTRLQTDAFEKDTAVLQSFYESVRMNVGKLDNLAAKQTVIKNLYEKFFAGAFPLTVEKLGIVYTPVECVDFIIRSVNSLLQQEFDTTLSAPGVHILDPFTGTGTFITRLLQSECIRTEDLERKYRSEIHCNEIVLLAFYIADVNIEAVFHDRTRRTAYLPYDNICLTDTFQLAEPEHNALFTEYFQENTRKVQQLKHTPIRVIMSNPPYSVGQKSTNDNAQNMAYPAVDGRVAETYAKLSTANLRIALNDSYIKAFRWASDRIPKDEGGIVAFISNGAWLDGSSQDGMRQCFEQEFSSIYVLNLRGNQRTSGELSRKEGGKIFGSGSRTPIAITFLVKNPHKTGKARIYYHDIGDYLTREQKLKMVADFRSIEGIDWQEIHPNEKNDWINQRDGVFDTLIPLYPEKKTDKKAIFTEKSIGIATCRDVWVYGFSERAIAHNVCKMVDFFNSQLENETNSLNDKNQIGWTTALWNRYHKNQRLVTETRYVESVYRPFCKQKLYFSKTLNEVQGSWETALLPRAQSVNKIIGVTGKGSSKSFSTLISDNYIDYQSLSNTQCFPLYWYSVREEKGVQQVLFADEAGASDSRYIRHDGISDWILGEVRSRFSGTRMITKEHIFYYVYGLLHSPDYRSRFADDLKKSLPRIPIVEKIEDFITISQIGRKLADLHLNYEHRPAPEGVVVEGDPHTDDYAAYRVEKMAFAKVRNEQGKLVADKSVIVYNHRIRITRIPAEVYDYVVNGKPAVEWIMERYAVTTDKASGICNDPNDWATEHHQPRYILDLLLSIISVSLESTALILQLPTLNL